MRECQWFPKDVDQDGVKLWEGSIKIKVPFQHERLEFLKKLNLKLNSDGTLAAASGNPIDVAINVNKAVRDSVTAVDLTFVESGDKFVNLDDLGVYEEGAKVISDLGTFLTNGFKLGKK